MASNIASDLSGIVASGGGSVQTPANAGKKPTSGSGVKGVAAKTVRAPAPAPGLPQTPQPRKQAPPQSVGHLPPLHPQQHPQFSASNPMLMVQPPPTPHPGVAPPYPDARTPATPMMANGQIIMPPTAGFIGAGMPPRVPATFIPGMTGLLGR